MFRKEIVCAGSEIVSTPSPWVEGDVLTVLARETAVNARPGRSHAENDVSFERVRGGAESDCWSSWFPALLSNR